MTLTALKEGEASPTATEAPTEAWICGWAPRGRTDQWVEGNDSRFITLMILFYYLITYSLCS